MKINVCMNYFKRNNIRDISIRFIIICYTRGTGYLFRTNSLVDRFFEVRLNCEFVSRSTGLDTSIRHVDCVQFRSYRLQ